MHKSWWVTQLDRKQFTDQLTHVADFASAKVYRLNLVSSEVTVIRVYSSVFTLVDPRDQLQLSYEEPSEEGSKSRWTLKKVPLHVAKKLPFATYVDVGNNMIRVFEEVSEFTRRY